MAWHRYHALHGVCHLLGSSRCSPRPTSADHTIRSSASLVHRATPMGSTAQPHGHHPPEASRVYGPPGKGTTTECSHLSGSCPTWSGMHIGPATAVPYQSVGGGVPRPMSVPDNRRLRGTLDVLGDAVFGPAIVLVPTECRTRRSILGTRPTPDNAPSRHRRKLVAITPQDLWQQLNR